jgi:hypothetical protein
LLHIRNTAASTSRPCVMGQMYCSPPPPPTHTHHHHTHTPSLHLLHTPPPQVLVWDLRDKWETLETGKLAASLAKAPKLMAKHVLAGHTKTVEDVVFKPASEHELCSVGDDSKVGSGGLVGHDGLADHCSHGL